MARKLIWKIIHAIILLNFIIEIGYCTFMVFFVLNAGTSGPLFETVLTIDMDLFLKRRLYAIETWIAIGGLALYVAITELYPRFKRDMINQASSKASES